MSYTIKPTPDFELHCGDARDVLTDLPDDSVDLIFTSPPYAERRKNSYGGVHADGYVEWFLAVSEELLRVMKPGGSFVLNIKEHAVNGYLRSRIDLGVEATGVAVDRRIHVAQEGQLPRQVA